MTVFAFDVGETLVDETRMWTRHAGRLGIPTFTFFGVFGALISQGRDHRDVFDVFGIDTRAYLAEIDALGDPADGITIDDFYPDALPTLHALVAAGHDVGLAANQPERAATELTAIGLPLSFLATSAGWGVAKPSAAFFDRLVLAAGVAPEEIVYVGDRLDNDVLPAKAHGMQAMLIRRGPWGRLHATWPDAARADRIIDSLAELLVSDSIPM